MTASTYGDLLQALSTAVRSADQRPPTTAQDVRGFLTALPYATEAIALALPYSQL